MKYVYTTWYTFSAPEVDPLRPAQTDAPILTGSGNEPVYSSNMYPLSDQLEGFLACLNCAAFFHPIAIVDVSIQSVELTAVATPRSARGISI